VGKKNHGSREDILRFEGPARRLDGFGAPTVWHEFSPLAKESGAINLGQGFPDWSPPSFVRDAMVTAVNGSAMNSQYCRSQGHLPLVQALAKHYSVSFGREIDALTEITTSVGSTEALYMTFVGLCNPEDDVLLMEPAFDLYAAQAQMAGASVSAVPFRHIPDKQGNEAFELDMAELESKIGEKTKLLVLNNPHNPTGKMLSLEELQAIAAIVSRHPRLMVLSDEVYDHMTYDGIQHLRFANLEGMWERTITISSAGKTFSVTGWKVGWAIGPATLIGAVAQVGTWTHFSVPTITQHALALALEAAEAPYEKFPNYFAYLSHMYLSKRDFMVDTLRRAGLKPVVPSGAFYIICDTSEANIPDKYMSAAPSASCGKVMTRDWAFCRWITIDVGVAAIPPSAFYGNENKHLAANLARFAFCKSDEVLQEAQAKLFAHFGDSDTETR